MSSQELIETLQQIGYPKAQSLAARSLEWVFEDEAVLPFLSWFCSNVSHQNVLSEEEQKSFAELEQQTGVQILEGALLEEALACLPVKQQEAGSLEALREEVETMKEDLERLQKRKEKLVRTRNTFSLHHTALTHRLSKLGDLESAKKQQYRRSMDRCHRTNSECNASLMRLGENVQRLCSLYGDQKQSETMAEEPVFLSQLSLDAFHKAEENYAMELTSFTKKLFFEGIADIAGGEVSRYQLLEVSDPTSLLVKGQSQEQFQLDCEELARLKAIFPKSEGERINTLVQAECAISVSAKADEILRQLQDGQFPSDITELRRQLEEVQQQQQQLKSEVEAVTGGEGELAGLIRELGSLQGTRVVTGDHQLKLARQDYFTSNQDQVIKYLVSQRARNEFLTMAYEVELRNHRNIHCLLTAIRDVLNERLTQHQARMEAMEDPALTKAKYDRKTIDTQDVATTCLHKMLVPCEEGGERRQLFLPYSTLVQGAEQLKASHSQTTTQASATVDKYSDRVQTLEEAVEQCESALYADSSTVGGQPMLMSRPLLEAHSQLGDLCQKLEAALTDSAKFIASKKKALRMDVLQVKERELFVNFHLHPEQLKQTMEMLETRLEAHRISSSQHAAVNPTLPSKPSDTGAQRHASSKTDTKTVRSADSKMDPTPDSNTQRSSSNSKTQRSKRP